MLNLLAISILLGIGSSSSSKRIEIDFETVFTGRPKTDLIVFHVFFMSFLHLLNKMVKYISFHFHLIYSAFKRRDTQYKHTNHYFTKKINKSLKLFIKPVLLSH